MRKVCVSAATGWTAGADAAAVVEGADTDLVSSASRRTAGGGNCVHWFSRLGKVTMESAKLKHGGTDRPFLILTLQRTGGTNLTSRLAHVSSRNLAKTHEPFNRPRIYGHVTKAWEQDKDRRALDASMATICSRQENVKHCVEMVPPEITEALIKAAIHADYRFLFLYREDPVARILSVEYASRTKIWGPRHVEKVTNDAAAFEAPLDVEALFDRESDCIGRLNAAWEQLVAGGAFPVALSYEALYAQDQSRAWAGFSEVLSRLDLSRGEEKDRELLEKIRRNGDQNTRSRYAQFDGSQMLRYRAGFLPRYRFDDNFYGRSSSRDCSTRSVNPGPDNMTAQETPTTPVNTQIRDFIADISPLFRGRQVFIADVGAHVGATFAAFYQSSLRVNRACLFEANPKNFAQLEAHVAELSAEKRATCLQIAVSDKPGTLHLHDMNDMSRIIDADPEENAVNDGQIFEVDAKPLDDFRTLFPDGHISILKVDVEGHERAVLHGAAGLLSDHAIEVIYVEAGFDKENPQQTHYREIEDLLFEHGYRLFKIYEQTMEWVDDRPLLRRVNMAFISPDVATRYPYSILKELAQLDARIGQKDQEIDTLHHALKMKEAEVQTLTQALEELRRDQVATNAKLEESSGKLATSHKELAILSRQVHELERKASNNEDLEARFEAAQMDLAKTTVQLQAKTSQFSESQRALESSSRLMQELERTISNDRELRAILAKTLAKLEVTEAKLAERQKRVQDLEASNSWLATAPMRRVSRWLKGR